MGPIVETITGASAYAEGMHSATPQIRERIRKRMNTSTNQYLLKATNLSINLHGRQILDNVTLEIPEGNIVTVIGPNGSGKTTLIQSLIGIRTPDSGTIQRKEGLSIGYMPQKLDVNSMLPMTLERFVMLGKRIPKSEETLNTLLDELRILHLRHKQIIHLSGGEWQRMMLARALLAKPDLLVLDEPTQGMDISGQIAFYRLIDSIQKTQNLTILMVSHDLHTVMRKTDHVYCLHHHICCHGTPNDVSNNPEYHSLFGKEHAELLSVYSHEHDHDHH